jgi:hypothetical protein
MNPLTAYAASIEELRHSPTEELDIVACRMHHAAISHVWRAPRWINWWRERKLHGLQRLHVELALKIPRGAS